MNYRLGRGLTAFRIGVPTVVGAQGVPATTQSYVELVAGYAAWYAIQPDFGGPADAAPPATANATGQGLAPSAADAIPVPDTLVAPIVAAGNLCPTVTPARIAGQLMAVSRFNDQLVGSSGATGVAQFRTELWNQYAPAPAADPLNAQVAVPALGRAMCDLSARSTGATADPYSVALAAFQFGTDVVAQSGGVPGSDNVQAFILRVLVYAEHYRGDPRLASKPRTAPTPGSGQSTAPPAPPHRPNPQSPNPAPTTTPPRQGRLVSADSGKCLTAAAATSGTDLTIQPCGNGQVQQWTIMSDNTILAAGLCMDLSGSSTANRTPIQIHTCNGSPAQQFKLNTTDDLVAMMIGKCVDILDGKPDDGQPAGLWICTGTANQTWHLQ